jgi:uncharacterized protein (TIGR02001 family)
MRNLLIIGALAAATVPAAFAQEAVTITGNVALATDYAFRGISQTSQNPAIQGGFDATFGSSGFYAGTWASNVAFGGSLELDAYAGWKTTVGPVGIDVGVLGYFYPGASDDFAELDYYEGYAKASITPATGFTLGGAVYYSPEFTLETGVGIYYEVNGAYTVSDTLSFSGAFGQQSIDDVNGPFSATEVDDDYQTWNVGGTYNALGLGFDLRYVGTSIDDDSDVVLEGFTNVVDSDDRIIFSIKKAL